MIVKEERIGGQRLILGDCVSVMPTLGRFDAVVTDPPYGVLAESGSAATRRKGGNGICAWDVVPAQSVFGAVLEMAPAAMLWGGCHMPLPPTFGYLIWDKACEGLNFGEVEFCWTNRRFAPRMFRFRAASMDGGKQHPTQKPVALMEWCLGFLPDAKTILDPFLGSGTTLVACQRLGRHGTGIEIDPDYFQTACERVHKAWREPDMFIAEPKPAPVQEGFDL